VNTPDARRPTDMDFSDPRPVIDLSSVPQPRTSDHRPTHRPTLRLGLRDAIRYRPLQWHRKIRLARPSETLQDRFLGVGRSG